MLNADRFPIWLRILLVCSLGLVLGIQPDPSQIKTEYQAAGQARTNQLPEAAAAHLQRVVALQPWRVEVWEQLGFDELSAGKAGLAVEAFEKARSLGKLTSAGQMALGDAYFKKGDTQVALKEWRALVANEVLVSQAYEKIYQIQRSSGNLEAALETLQDWSALEPGSASLLYQKGLLKLTLSPGGGLPAELLDAARSEGQFSQKVETLRKAVGLVGTSEEAAYQYLAVGRALANLGEWELAQADFETALRLSPDYPEALAFLGEAHQHLGKDGIDELTRAVVLKPDSIVVQALLSVYWRRNGQPEAALPYLKQMIVQEPNQALWQVEAGNTLAQMGNLIAALPYYQQAVAMEPGNSLYWQALARFSVDNMVDLENIGLAAARQAMDLTPQDPDTLDLMGLVLFKLNDLVSAERFLQRALSKDGSFAAAHLHLGQVYLQWNRLDLAYPHLQSAEQLANGDPIGVMARRLITSYIPGG